MSAQHVRASVSTIHSNIQPTAGGTARRMMSTRICWPLRISHGAVSSVMRYSIASEISFAQASPTIPGTMRTLRRKTSAQIISVMPKMSAQPASAMNSSSRPYALSNFCMGRLDLFREDLLQLLAVLGTGLDRVGPADFLRLFDVSLVGRWVEGDDFDAGLRL